MQDASENIDFWSCQDGDEHLRHTDINDAIEEHLDASQENEGMAKVYGYQREVIKGSDLWDPLESILESLDEEYGDPGEASEPTEGMKKATEEYLAKVAAEYKPWACKIVKEVEVNIQEWIKEHRPDWLEEEQHGRQQED